MMIEEEKKRKIPTLDGDRQVYDRYTEEDQKVWKILFERQIGNIPGAATMEYLKGMERINYTGDRIPDFNETNKILKNLTGWEITAVPGIVDDSLFFSLMAGKRFPATTWLRTMAQLDYLEEPDMFHDVFAHVPLLTNQPFVDFLQGLSQIGARFVHNPEAIHALSRIYWYTVEFGLIRENRVLRIYGAGILSSAGETIYSLGSEPEHLDYDVDKVLNTPYRKDAYQTQYFVIDSYEDLYASLPLVTQRIEEQFGG